MVGGLFGGGSSQAAEQQPADNGAVNSQNQQAAGQNNWGAGNCDVDAKQFTKCLDENQGNMQICGWYLQQLVCLLSSCTPESMLTADSESVPKRCQPILGTLKL